MSTENINKAIDSLIELAEKEGDNNTQIVLLALRGTRSEPGMGYLLATHIQEFLKTRLIPMIEQKEQDDKVQRN